MSCPDVWRARLCSKACNLAQCQDRNDSCPPAPKLRASKAAFKSVLAAVHNEGSFPTTYSDAYQILMMHACRTYAYYTRQVFRAKATSDDPTGFALADVVASGHLTSPYDSPTTLEPLLRSLMDGIVATRDGEPRKAPSWLSIITRMNERTRDKLYGVAGVRSNTWQP